MEWLNVSFGLGVPWNYRDMKSAVNQENLGPLIYANNAVLDEIKKIMEER